MADTPTLSVLEPREKPDVGLIIRELRDAVNGANALGIFKKLEDCHLTRRCFWLGQADDGRMSSPSRDNKNLYWWEGAPEARRHKADEIIIERAGLRELVLHRGQVTVQPSLSELVESEDKEAREANDTDADTWQVVLDYYRKITQRETAAAWRLHCTCIEEFGYSVLYTGWKNRLRLDKRTIDAAQVLEAIVGIITQQNVEILQQQGIQVDPNQLPPEILDQIQAQAQEALGSILSGVDGDEEGIGVIRQIDPDIPEKEAGKVLKSIRNGEAGVYYAPEDDGGVPYPIALIPWVSVVHPVTLTGTGESDWIAVPEWIGKPELLARAEAEGWDQKFVDKVLEFPNKMMPELLSISLANQYSWVLNGAGIGLHIDTNYVNKETPVYQVFNVWRTSVTDAGLPMVYRTVMHPLVTDCYGLHEATKLKKLPFCIDTAEPVQNAMLSRGVGQIVIATQNHICDMLTAEGARAQLGSNPPLLRGVDQHVPVRPGLQLHVRTAGVKPVNEFMQTPQVDQGTLELIKLQEMFVDQRFFRGETVDPDIKQQHRELLAYQSMESLAHFWRLVWETIKANVDTARLTRIAGQPVYLHVTGDDLEGEAEIDVGFNVAGLSGDAADKWVSILEKLMAMDRGGSVDWTEAVKDLATMWNPAMAKKLIMPKDQAAKKIVDDQNNRIAQIVAGVPVDYAERATAPDLRMQTMQKWAQVPGNVQKTMQDQVVAELMQKEQQYLSLQVEQYQQNPLVGRTLVKPNS